MILRALKDYYDRMAQDEGSGIPLFGYSMEKIYGEIVINREGRLL